MTEKQKNKPQDNQHLPGTSGDIHGRLFNTHNPEFEQRPTRNDISHVDQQEGYMNNGECGDCQTDKEQK